MQENITLPTITVKQGSTLHIPQETLTQLKSEISRVYQIEGQISDEYATDFALELIKEWINFR